MFDPGIGRSDPEIRLCGGRRRTRMKLLDILCTRSGENKCNNAEERKSISCRVVVLCACVHNSTSNYRFMRVLVRDQMPTSHALSPSRKRTKSKKSTAEIKAGCHSAARILPKRDNIDMKRSSFEAAVVSPSGGVLTSRSLDPLHPVKCTALMNRIRHRINLDLLPAFAGCPDWIKPMMYQEYQVTRFDAILMFWIFVISIFLGSMCRLVTQRTGSVPFSRILPRTSTWRCEPRGFPA